MCRSILPLVLLLLPLHLHQILNFEFDHVSSMILMNITSPSSSLEQTNFVWEDWGTNPSDSSIEFSFRTCSVAMEANGSGCGCGLLGVDCDGVD
ncbi:hypothetical protein Tco_0635138 [Tanacetum coccineum]